MIIMGFFMRETFLTIKTTINIITDWLTVQNTHYRQLPTPYYSFVTWLAEATRWIRQHG